jgi:5'-nucleotidase
MRILIANDDGIYSPGIRCLARVARQFGDVRVVAPDVERSSAGHAITHSKPLNYRRTPVLDGIEAYRVDGTPADCVALGLHHWERVDVVLSGINLGPNLGHGIWHSGTLAAARQAVLLGFRGIALSTPVVEDQPDFEALEPHVEQALSLLLPRDDLRLVNVNVPPEPRGVRWTRQAVKRYDGTVVPGQDPMGRQIYWFTVIPIEKSEPGTDLWAIEHRFVSITPLRMDLTDDEGLARATGDRPLGESDDDDQAPEDLGVPEEDLEQSAGPVARRREV